MESPKQYNTQTLAKHQWTGMFSQIFKYIKNHNNVPWRQNWNTPAPINYYSKRPYSGFNVAMIGMIGQGDFAWATRRQISAQDHELDNSAKAIEENPSITVGFVEFPDREDEDLTERQRYENPEKPVIGVRRMTYEVYPASRIINPLTGDKVVDEDDALSKSLNNFVHTKVDKIYKAGDFKFKQGSKPLYNRTTDTIHMPPAKNFESDHEFEATKLHEVGHATLHETRYGDEKSIAVKLTRDAGEYGREELTAEIFAMMARQECGIQDSRVIEDSLSYVEGWYKSLAKDPEILLWACGDAQKRFNWVQERIAS